MLQSSIMNAERRERPIRQRIHTIVDFLKERVTTKQLPEADIQIPVSDLLSPSGVPKRMTRENLIPFMFQVSDAIGNRLDAEGKVSESFVAKMTGRGHRLALLQLSQDADRGTDGIADGGLIVRVGETDYSVIDGKWNKHNLNTSIHELKDADFSELMKGVRRGLSKKNIIHVNVQPHSEI